MKKFGLIGKDISYSLSPFIHNQLLKHFNIKGTYDLIDIKDIDSICKDDLLEYDGLNITIPYKEVIADLTDSIVSDAKSLKIINTLNIKDKIFGYNTDILGFDKFYKTNIVDVKEVGILAGSATAKMLKYYFKNYHNIDVKIFSSKVSAHTFKYEDISNHKIDFLINTSPLGQGKYLNKSIITKETLKNINPKYVLDFNYNPFNTKLLKDSKDLNYKTFNGLEILINQAIYSFEIWNDIKVEQEVFKDVKNKVINETINNHLIYGMPLSGKSTMTKDLKHTCKGQHLLIDLDEYITNEFIVNKTKFKSIKEYVNTNGISEFRILEYNALKELLNEASKKVIFLGGGTLTNSKIYSLLDNTLLYYLDTKYETLIKRLQNPDVIQRPLLKGSNQNEIIDNYKNLYNDRIKRYNNIYDYKIKSIEDLKCKLPALGE